MQPTYYIPVPSLVGSQIQASTITCFDRCMPYELLRVLELWSVVVLMVVYMMSWHLVIVAHDWPPIAINNNGASEMRAPSINMVCMSLSFPFPSLHSVLCTSLISRGSRFALGLKLQGSKKLGIQNNIRPIYIYIYGINNQCQQWYFKAFVCGYQFVFGW